MKLKNLVSILVIVITMVTISTSCIKCYEEDPPVVESREKFIGNYDVKDTSYNVNSGYLYGSYVMVIKKEPTDTTKIILTNLNNQGEETTAAVSGNIFVITKQPLTTSYEVSGTGEIEGSKLTFDLTLHCYEARDLTGVGIKK